LHPLPVARRSARCDDLGTPRQKDGMISSHEPT
jgi:hypothetical protein